MLRSIGAILFGFILIACLSFGGDALMRAFMPSAFASGYMNASVGLLLAVQAYVSVFAILGCYVAARLAPNHPMRHALILGLLGLLFNLVGTYMMWDTAPAWYHVLALALVMPLAWTGGWLRERQLAHARPGLSAA